MDPNMFWKVIVKDDAREEEKIVSPEKNATFYKFELESELRRQLQNEYELCNIESRRLKGIFLSCENEKIHKLCEEAEIINDRVCMKIDDIQQKMDRCQEYMNRNVFFLKGIMTVCSEIQESIKGLDMEVNRYHEIKNEIYSVYSVEDNESPRGNTENVVVDEDEDSQSNDDAEKRFMEAYNSHCMEEEEQEEDLHAILKDLIAHISKLKRPMQHDNMDALEMQLPIIEDFSYPCRVKYPEELERQQKFLHCMIQLYEAVEDVCVKTRVKSASVYSNAMLLRELLTQSGMNKI